MRWNSFARSILFAAAAGLGVIPFIMIATPWLGQTTALSLYGVGVISVYVAGIGKRWSHGIRMAALAAVLGVGVLIIAGRFFEVVIGVTVILAICRSGFIFRRPMARSLAIEVAIGGASLLAAHLLLGPTYLGLALACWAYMLIQSAYFLVGGEKSSSEEDPSRDPFEVAKGRAVEMMERL